MEKVFGNVLELMTREDYDKSLSYVKQLINEATINGALDNPEADNEYIREIGRVGRLCVGYEDTKMSFKHLEVKQAKKYAI
jgi:hypothetical protein